MDPFGQTFDDFGSRRKVIQAHQARIDNLACNAITLKTNCVGGTNCAVNEVLGQPIVTIGGTSGIVDSDLAITKARTDPTMKIYLNEGTYDFGIWNISRRNVEIIGDTRNCVGLQFFVSCVTPPSVDGVAFTPQTVQSITPSGNNTLTVVTSGTDPDFEELGLVAGDTILFWDDDTLNECTLHTAATSTTVVSVTANSITCTAAVFTGLTFTEKGAGFLILPNVHMLGRFIGADAMIKTQGIDFTYATAAAFGPVLMGDCTFSSSYCTYTLGALATGYMLYGVNSTMTLYACSFSAYTNYIYDMLRLAACQTYMSYCFLGGNDISDYLMSGVDMEGGSLQIPTFMTCIRCGTGLYASGGSVVVDGAIYGCSNYNFVMVEDGCQMDLINMVTLRNWNVPIQSNDDADVSFHSSNTFNFADDDHFSVNPTEACVAAVSYGGTISFEVSIGYVAPTVAAFYPFVYDYRPSGTFSTHVAEPNVPSRVSNSEGVGAIIRTSSWAGTSSPYFYQTVEAVTNLSGGATSASYAINHISTNAIIGACCVNPASVPAALFMICPGETADTLTVFGTTANKISWKILADH